MRKALDDSVLVRHKGLPGWTARSMVEAADDPDNGLRSLLRKVIKEVAGVELSHSNLRDCIRQNGRICQS